jgi:cyclopropane-fatty-acyl-phospholipid synthase
MHFGQPGTQQSLELTIREYRFFRRVMVSGDTGFGEAYTDGDWSTSDLPGLLTLLASNEAVMDDRSIITSAIGRAINYLRHLRRPNTIRGSDRNIREHYDLSNEFFATFLDPTMTYSCALFNGPGDTLEQAQRNKLRTIIDKAGIAAEHHVLEIGCGWGSFAIEAVRQTGCRVTGITISREQLELAQQRVAAAGLQERIELRLCDYRHIDGRYDKIVSIEMLEAVGHAGLRPFFKACHDALLPGGSAVIQVITIPDRKYNAYRYSSDWIRKHIFPGGHLPSMGAMKTAVSQTSDLRLDDVQGYAADYATTLQRWRQTLLEKQQEIKAMGFDDAFIRKWEYYFAYCHAGFRAEIIDLVQMVLNKPE